MLAILDRQERLLFWYGNRTRKDYYVQGWKRGRIYADFIFTLRREEADAAARERPDEPIRCSSWRPRAFT